MSGRQSAAMDNALHLVKKGQNIMTAADIAGVDIRSLRRALRRNGVEPSTITEGHRRRRLAIKRAATAQPKA